MNLAIQPVFKYFILENIFLLQEIDSLNLYKEALNHRQKNDFDAALQLFHATLDIPSIQNVKYFQFSLISNLIFENFTISNCLFLGLFCF